MNKPDLNHPQLVSTLGYTDKRLFDAVKYHKQGIIAHRPARTDR